MSTIKERGGSVTAPKQEGTLKDKLFSTNFIMAVVLLIGGLFVGFPQGEAQKVVGSIFALIGSAGALRVFFKTAELNPVEWIKNSNTWNYISTIFIALFPVLTPDFFAAVKAIVEQALGGNWQGILTSLISLATIIWNIFKNSQALPTVPKIVTPAIIVLLCSVSTFAQSNRDLEKSYSRNVKAIQQDTFEILPQPGEYPQDVQGQTTKRDGTRVMVSNWGADTHKLTALRARIASECKNRVHIRIVDTAMDSDHQQLVRGKQKGTNYTTDAPGNDKNGHGTHVAGIIFASDFGICYDLAKSGVVTYEFNQILSGTGAGSFSWFEKCEKDQNAKDWSRKQNGIRTVVSGSFGGNTVAIGTVEDAMKANTTNGTVYCIAAGNTGTDGVQYPGHSQYVIACASLDQNLTRSSYSTFGPQVWAGQPGRSIQSTWLNNQFATLSGTSMATPFLSGCVAIALSKWGDLLPDYKAVKSYLAAVSNDISPTGKDNQTGYGIALIEAILNTKPGTVAPPNPPNPPIDTTQPPIRGQRSLSFAYDGKYTMYWSTISSASTGNEPKIIKVSKKMKSSNALNAITLTRIELSVSSTTTAQFQDKIIKDAFNTLIFNNRGLMLDGGSDFADAVYWTAYFTELLLYTQYKIKTNIVISRIDGNDGNGNAVFFTKEQLKHSPKAVNGFSYIVPN